MWNRNSVGITVVIFLLFADLMIYNYQYANSSKAIIISCSVGKPYSQLKVPETIEYDSVSRAGSSHIKALW